MVYILYSLCNLGGSKSYGSSSYKLLPDVEISKTNFNHTLEGVRREDVVKHLVEHGTTASTAGPVSTESNRMYLNKRIPAVSQPQVTVRQDLVDNESVKRDATQHNQPVVSPAVAAAAAAMSAKFQQNGHGLVTLSR